MWKFLSGVVDEIEDAAGSIVRNAPKPVAEVAGVLGSVVESGIETGSNLYHAVDEVIHPENYISEERNRPYEPKSCQFCRALTIDLSLAIPATSERLRYCRCTKCQRWLSTMTSKYDNPIFLAFEGSKVINCLTNHCDGMRQFFKLKSTQTPGVKLSDLLLCVECKPGSRVDILHVEYNGPHDPTTAEQEDCGPECYFFAVSADESDPAGRYVTSRPPVEDFSNPIAFKTAKGWYRECHDHHDQCQIEEEGRQFGPKRVIRVMQNASKLVYLYERAFPNKIQPYVALSYCWGQDQLRKTTMTNYHERQKGFPVAILPKTICDAIEITRRLGLQYLWVDSLCIVQDDPDDKAAELAKMHVIYENAELLISASLSKCAEDGILGTYLPAVCKMPVKYQCPDGQMGSLRLMFQPEGGVDEEPIHDRAWTMQEHLLCHRMLVYGCRGLRWSCRTSFWYDGPWAKMDLKANYAEEIQTSSGAKWPLILISQPSHCSQDLIRSTEYLFNNDTGFNLNLDGDFLRELAKPLELNKPPAHSQQSFLKRAPILRKLDVLQEWRRLVYSFNGRNISQEQDRLPAISAIVAKFDLLFPGRYLAGHWEAFLPFDLLWSTKDDYCKQKSQSAPFPSWSWASVNESVIWNDFPDTFVTLVMRKARVKLLYQDVPYGHVLSASLNVAGHLMEVECKSVGATLADKVPDFPFSMMSDKCHMPAYLVPRTLRSTDRGNTGVPVIGAHLDEIDCGERKSLRVRWYCLEILRRRAEVAQEDWVPSTGLVLSRVRGNEFVRVGIFYTGKMEQGKWIIPGQKAALGGKASSLFDECPKVKIDLI